MRIILIFIIAIFLFILWARYMEAKSLFFPMKGITMTPAEIGLEYEDVYFETKDNVKLNGWFIPQGTAGLTILYAHGNAGNIGHRLEKIRILHEIGLNIFIFDYRSYGKSEGNAASESGLYKDIESAYDYLVKKRGISPEDIVPYGESLGGAVAIDLASKAKIGGLIIEETFTSVKDMAQMAYPYLPSFIFSSRFNSVPKMRTINAPVLVIHSADDEIVPFRMGKELYENAKDPKEFLQLRGGHNTAFIDSREKYKKGIKSFIYFLKD